MFGLATYAFGRFVKTSKPSARSLKPRVQGRYRLLIRMHFRYCPYDCRENSTGTRPLAIVSGSVPGSSPQSLGEVSGTVAHSFPQSPRATPHLDSAHHHHQQNIPNLNVVYDAGSLDTGSGGTRQVRGESVFLCVWGARLRDRGLATADVLLE